MQSNMKKISKWYQNYIKKPLQNLSKNLLKTSLKTYYKSIKKSLKNRSKKPLQKQLEIRPHINREIIKKPQVFSKKNEDFVEQPGLTMEREARLIVETILR